MLYFVSVTPFSGEKADPAKPAFYLNTLAGTQVPERARVVKVEYAKSRGMEVGETYCISLEAIPKDEYINYRLNVIKKLSLNDILSLQGMSVPQVVKPVASTVVVEEESSGDLPF